MKKTAVMSAGVSTLFLMSISAMAAGPFCSPDGMYCGFDKMPLYDQTNEAIDPRHVDWLPNGGNHSMLCGPTTAAMVLGAAVSHKNSDVFLQGFTKSFSSMNEVQRIREMSALLGTRAKAGTTLKEERRGTSDRGSDFFVYDRGVKRSLAKGGMESDNPNTSAEGYMRGIRSGKIYALDYGHYTKKRKSVWFYKYTTYERSGGHFVAIKGVWRSPQFGAILELNNPWRGVREWKGVFRMELPDPGSRLIDLLPGYDNIAYHLGNSGNYYPIIDGYTYLPSY